LLYIYNTYIYCPDDYPVVQQVVRIVRVPI